MEPVFAPARDAESPRIIDLSDDLKRAAAGSPGVERKILLQCDDTAEAALLAANGALERARGDVARLQRRLANSVLV